MKHPLIFVIISMLILLGICVFEQYYLESMQNSFCKKVDELELVFLSGDSVKLEEKISELAKEWEDRKKILSIITSHDDIGNIEETLITYISFLQKKMSYPEVSTNSALLKMYIRHMAENSKFIFENIL